MTGRFDDTSLVLNVRVFFFFFFFSGLVLPKFSVTETVPQMHSVGDVGLKVEACAK